MKLPVVIEVAAGAKGAKGAKAKDRFGAGERPTGAGARARDC
jgi:hypothetical protein